MELYEIRQGVNTHQAKLKQLGESLDLTARRYKIQELTAKTLEESFWNDPQKAQVVIRQLNATKDVVDSYDALQKALSSLDETQELLKEDFDEEIFELFELEYQEMEKNFADFEIKVLLSHEYDHSSAILELHPGAGGTESCDWADMLYRMYSRWAEKHEFKVSVLDYQPGDEAGIKSITFLVEGDMAYGYLKAEKGVHRLVRISPFDAGGRRHTSFASLDVMPQFNDEIEIEIKPEDLIVETKRASGAGGQHINKTDSAVRMVHKPTGLVATCQNGRSQHENREEALRVLKSRLYQKMIEEQEAKLAEIKGEVKANEWGSQIRSYVFHPYSMVKDHRTNYETSDVQGVMDGDLDGFIFAYLKTLIQ
ncbi:peptide chain release factor 2 [Eubacterium sp. TF05-29]|uniref:peptide chain release factor 2 n=1 Tax=Longicatena caecimuris TaxID=1796635 RepID=UPI000E719B6C|nr:peptide chain release factor 2 [Longicatena caecimuris]RJV88886.1 peptide chain release factor 2 [Eubacterium sp. AF18-3]RJW10178.1 peptide chain release factor 2 [Eubacterium sp. AM28-8LB]RJW19393.1 peptide chain release factor 2 [Eubacterium sp. TF12-12]RJW25058.1 peptide chain release factor 2 [Eubacterium sp. TF05-29]